MVNYLQNTYANGTQNAQPYGVSGPASVGISARGSANIAGPVALLVILVGVTAFYVATHKIQGSV